MENELRNSGSVRFSAASLEVLPDEAPLTVLGEWINGVLISREISMSEAKRVFNLCTIGALRKKDIATLSLYTFENLLQGADRLGCGEEEIDRLADIVSEAFEQKFVNGSDLSGRTPPRVPAAIANGNGEYSTDSKLARELSGQKGFDVPNVTIRGRIQRARKKLGISPVFTSVQEAEILQELRGKFPE